MKTRQTWRRRKGSILTLAAVMMVLMFGMLAVAVDLGYVTLVRSQLQNSADSAALAATWDLINPDNLGSPSTSAAMLASGRANAGRFAGLNTVSGAAPTLTLDDVAFGRLDYLADGSKVLNFTSNFTSYNATRVRVRRATAQNGEVPMFFARVLGISSSPGQAEATAAFIDNFAGFRTPTPATDNLGILPFALDKQSWDALLAQGGPDNWAWNEQTGQLAAGSDGIPEINLYPQGTGSPGNRGTVDIGSSNNSTADISRQIRDGISADDMTKLGRPLEIPPGGSLSLNADTGISAGVKDDLASIRGQPRIIPIFDSVNGQGNCAHYSIVAFAGVRVTEVVLTGKMTSKRVMLQPARVELRGGIPATDGVQHSYSIYSPVWLVK